MTPYYCLHGIPSQALLCERGLAVCRKLELDMSDEEYTSVVRDGGEEAFVALLELLRRPSMRCLE